MKDDLELQLRSTLRRQPAPAGFAERTIARATRTARPIRAWVSMALAATLLVGFAGAGIYRARERQRGEEAKQQLMLALQITSQKLAVVEKALDRSVN